MKINFEINMPSNVISGMRDTIESFYTKPYVFDGGALFMAYELVCQLPIFGPTPPSLGRWFGGLAAFTTGFFASKIINELPEPTRGALKTLLNDRKINLAIGLGAIALAFLVPKVGIVSNIALSHVLCAGLVDTLPYPPQETIFRSEENPVRA